MARQKSTNTPLKELYTEATMELMYLRRAFRTLKEHHPDFRNLNLVEDRGEESFAEFIGKVKHIAEEARRRGGGGVQNNPNDIMPQYLGLMNDLPTMFNPITAMDAERDED